MMSDKSILNEIPSLGKLPKHINQGDYKVSISKFHSEKNPAKKFLMYFYTEIDPVRDLINNYHTWSINYCVNAFLDEPEEHSLLDECEKPLSDQIIQIRLSDEEYFGLSVIRVLLEYSPSVLVSEDVLLKRLKENAKHIKAFLMFMDGAKRGSTLSLDNDANEVLNTLIELIDPVS